MSVLNVHEVLFLDPGFKLSVVCKEAVVDVLVRVALFIFIGLACVERSWSNLVLFADWLPSPVRSLHSDPSTCLGYLIRRCGASPISSILSPALCAGGISCARVCTRVTRDIELHTIRDPSIVLVGWAVVREELRRENLVGLPIRLRVSDAHLVLFDIDGDEALFNLYPLLLTADLLEDVPDQVLLCTEVFLNIVLIRASFRLFQRICALLLDHLVQS